VTDEKEIALSADRLWAGIAFLMTAITAAVGHLFKRHIKRIDDQGARIEDLEKAMLKKIDHGDVAEMLDSIRKEIREHGKETTQRFDQILLALGKK
jgi:hypothetical protein